MYRKLCLMALIAIFAIPAPGCGGGGTGSGPAAPGRVSGYVDIGGVARKAPRAAELTPAPNAMLVLVAGTEELTAVAAASGWFSIPEVPPGTYREVTATYGTTVLKGYYDVSPLKNTLKNINSRSTAAAMVYKKLVAERISAPASITTIEASPLIAGVEDAIESAMASGTYSYSDIANGTLVDAVVRKIQAGGSFSDTKAPALNVSVPEAGGLVSDVEFRAKAFYIEVSYSDAAPMDIASLSATLSMDGGEPRDITSYFSAADTKTLRSDGLYAFNRTLFSLVGNDRARTMAINISMKDMSGNTGSETSTFVVYPGAPPSQ